MVKRSLMLLLELIKVRITFFVTVSTVFGFICASGDFNTGVLLPALGLFFIACSSAILNHIQEHKYDKLMARTKNRPLPSGKVSVRSALLITIAFLIPGMIIEYYATGITGLTLSLMALVWYNGIYTPLKRKNSLAIIPGSVIGALPPLVGWVAGRGDLMDPQAWLIAFFFFIWQIPHFWLLTIVHYKDYHSAGYPTLRNKLSQEQLSRITYFWTVVTGFTAVMMPLFQIVKPQYAGYAIVAAFFWLAIVSLKLLKKTESTKPAFEVFKQINYFALTIVLVVILDKLVIYF